MKPLLWENFENSTPQPFIKKGTGQTLIHPENVIYNVLTRIQVESIPKKDAVEHIDLDVVFIVDNENIGAKQYHFPRSSVT